MLKSNHIKKASLYESWNGYINLNYFSGYVDNLIEKESCWEFYLRQTPFKNHKLKVKLDKGDFLPTFFSESKNPLVKIIGRIQQDSTKSYRTLIIRPLHLARPSLLEVPTKKNFYKIGKHGEENKIFKPVMELRDFEKASFNMQRQIVDRFANKVHLSGFVRSKKMDSSDCLSIEIFNSENRIIPLRFYGKLAKIYHKNLDYLQPLLIEGRVEARVDKENSEIQNYVKVENISPIVTPGKHIPKIVPNWYLKLQEIYENMDSIDDDKIMVEVDSNINSDSLPLFSEEFESRSNLDMQSILRELEFEGET